MAKIKALREKTTAPRNPKSPHIFVDVFQKIYDALTKTEHIWIASYVILALDLILNVVIIHRVNYTEIDWKAYMQECEGFLNGTWDYSKLKGDTGPLVYPAAFVYIYSALYYVTSGGVNIRLAQYVFAVIYTLQLFFALRIYARTKKVAPYVLFIATFTSYRIHSLYTLRLFNDTIAVLLFYIALNLFMESRWTWGSVFYSVAVAVKMNILLYAPALFFTYLFNLGIVGTIIHLSVCACVQVILAVPFLIGNPRAYLRGAFDLGRVFEHKWTVNYRFLPIDIFSSAWFHVTLLGVHVFLLGAFLFKMRKYFTSYVELKEVEAQMNVQIHARNEKERNDKSKLSIDFSTTNKLFVLPFFVANFIGVVCARSLHYQFYAWYFHSLPYVIWSTDMREWARFLVLALVEMCWNTYPSTVFSSALLHACHALILVNLWRKL